MKKCEIFKLSYYIKTVSIATKFDTMTKTINYFLWVITICIYQIQDRGWPLS